jgi:hypothetical protein
MSKFAYAGVSTLNGVTKVRFANDQMRIKVLAKNGHKNIDIVELKEPLTKEDAVAHLLKIDFDNGNKTVRAAIEAAADKRGVVATAPKAAPKAPVKAAPKAPAKKVEAVAKVAAPVTASAKAALEDAPY